MLVRIQSSVRPFLWNDRLIRSFLADALDGVISELNGALNGLIDTLGGLVDGLLDALNDTLSGLQLKGLDVPVLGGLL